MSNVIDEKVVSMQFDNRDFEENVKTSMNTLDKLKQSLKFDGAEKGLENVNRSIKGIDLSAIVNSVETVKQKFSVLDVVAITAISNITNTAVNSGKRLVKSLSVDQISGGWSKFEQKTASVQTIMNSTGKSIDEVNGYLDKLMWFSDETSYGFTDMTQALGQMTSSGADIEKVIPLITGMANATAYAGKGANEFQRSIYNLTQSYGAGHLQLMDWKSLDNAGTSSKALKEQLIAAGEELGKIKKGSVNIGNFADTLKKKWADTEVMEKAFGKFSELSDAAYKAVDEGKFETASEAIEALSGKYSTLASEAFKSAQQAKTFQDVIDATKDFISTQWMDTFEKIFGNYVEAKQMWTDLANWVYDLLAPLGEMRNAILDSALVKSFKEVAKQVEAVVKPIQNTTTGIQSSITSLKEYDKVVKQIINGNFGNGQKRYEALSKAGYDWAYAQNLVNEKLGSSVRHTTKLNLASSKEVSNSKTISKETIKRVESMAKMTDEQLKAIGMTNKEIKNLRDLVSTADRLGVSISYLLKNYKKLNGRTLGIEAFKNFGKAIMNIVDVAGDAWNETFYGTTNKKDIIKQRADSLINLIGAFKKLSNNVLAFTKQSKDLSKVFKGLFSVAELLSSIYKGALSVALSVLSKTYETFGGRVLSFAASIGESLSSFTAWVKENLSLTDSLKELGEAIVMFVKHLIEFLDKSGQISKTNSVILNFIKKAGNGFKGLVDTLKTGISTVSKFLREFDSFDKINFKTIGSIIQSFGKNVLDYLLNIPENFGDIPKRIIDGFTNGLSGKLQPLIDIVVSVVSNMVASVKKVLGIHSPSTVFFEIGYNIMMGLINGIKSGIDYLYTLVRNILADVSNIIKSIDPGAMIALSISTGMMYSTNKIASVLDKFANPFVAVGGLIKSVTTLSDTLTKSIQQKAFKSIATSILLVATAVGILAASLWVLSKVPINDLWQTALLLGTLIASIAYLVSKSGSVTNIADMGKIAIAFVGIGASLILLAAAFKMIANVEMEGLITKVFLFSTLFAEMIGAIYIFGKSVDPMSAEYIAGIGTLMIGFAIALILVSKALNTLSDIGGDQAATAMLTIIAIGALFTAIVNMTKKAGPEMAKVGIMLLGMAAAIFIIMQIIKYAATLDGQVVLKGITVVGAVGLLFAAISRLVSSEGKNVAALGIMFIGMAVAVRLMASTIELFGEMDASNIKKGLIVVSGLGAIFALLTYVSKYAGNNAAKSGIMLIGVAASMIAISELMKIIGGMGYDEIKRALASITVIGLVFATLIAASHLANPVKNSIQSITIAMSVMVGALVILSMISEENLRKATAAIISVLLSMSAMFASLSFVKDESIIGKVLILTAFIGAMSYLIKMLSECDANSVVSSAIAIGILLIALSASLAIMSKMSDMKSIGLSIIVKILGIVVVLSAIVAALSNINSSNAIQNATALSMLLIALSVSMTIISKVGLLAQGAIKSMIILTLVIGMLTAILFAIDRLDIKAQFETIALLGTLLLAMSASISVLSFASLNPTAGLMAIAALSEFAAGLWLLVQAFGLLSKLPGGEENMRSGFKILTIMAEGIGNIAGSLVSGFVDGVSRVLPILGTALSDFMVNIQPFMAGSGEFAMAFVKTMAALCAGILLIQGTEILALLSGGFTLMNIALFAAQASSLATVLQEFKKATTDFTNDDAERLSKFASTIKDLASAASSIPSQGGILNEGLFGVKDLGKFANDIFKTIVDIKAGLALVGGKGFTDDDANQLRKVFSLVGEIGQIANQLPSQGGIWNEKIVGTKDMAEFMKQLGPSISAIAAASYMIRKEYGLTEADYASISTAMTCISGIIKSVEGMPKTDGWLDKIFGGHSLSDFTKGLPVVGQNLKGFSYWIGGLTDKDVTGITNAMKAIKSFGLINNVDLTGSKTALSHMKDNMTDYAKVISEFAKNSKGLNSKDVTESVNSLIKLADIFKKLENLDSGKVESFSSAIKSLTNLDMNSISKKLEGSDNFVKIGEGIIKSITSGIKDNASNVTSSVKNTLKETKKALSSQKEDFGKIGESLISSFGKAMQDAIGKVDLSSKLNSLKNVIRGYYVDMYNAGSWLVSGLATGIKSNNEAYNAAKNLANNINNTFKKTEEINSPSKVFMKFGRYISEGLAIGINDYSGKAVDATDNMADRISSGTKRAIQKLSSAIENNIDSQPTIRPVLDLSDISSGAGLLNDMLDLNPSLGVLSNVGSITGMMNGRVQNGTNKDVVSAIERLNNNLASLGGDTYNVNGVTYDDGSAISDAVGTIVKMTKIERRA